jgi:TP901-1 family phage major tail protein
MNPLVGRRVFIRKGDDSPQVLLAAGRTKSVTVNGAPIDITSDDDSGYRTLLEGDAGMLSLDLSFEGITKDTTLLNALAAGNFVDDYEIEVQGIGVFNGRFFITSVALNAPYNEAVTFTAELQSTGAFTFENADSP